MASKHKPKQLHYGVFFHYLNGLQNRTFPWNQGKKTSWDDCVNELNVEKIASQLEAIHADYLIFTLGQNERYLCLPNYKYEQLTGYKRGEATSHRDLISDLYNSLHKRGIQLFLYFTGDGPRADLQASRGLNNPIARQLSGGKFISDKLWVDTWSEVIRSISLQYGKKIKGWWFDGCYDFIGYNDSLLNSYFIAAKAGNKKAMVAFNFTGPQDFITSSTIGNYTAGESDKFESPPGSSLKNKMIQWHLLSYLGNGWAHPGIRYSASYMCSYIEKVKVNQGMITIDVCLLRDGTIDSAQFDFLKTINILLHG